MLAGKSQTFGGMEFLFLPWRGWVGFFTDPEGGWILFIPHKQALLINVIKTIEFGYIKYEFEMGLDFFRTCERGLEFFSSSMTKFPPPPNNIKWLLTKKVALFAKYEL